MSLVKTKRHKAWHVIYTSVIANLIFLAYSNSRSHNTSPRVEYHYQLSSLLVHWSYQKKSSRAVYYKYGAGRWQSTKDQLCISLNL